MSAQTSSLDQSLSQVNLNKAIKNKEALVKSFGADGTSLILCFISANAKASGAKHALVLRAKEIALNVS